MNPNGKGIEANHHTINIHAITNSRTADAASPDELHRPLIRDADDDNQIDFSSSSSSSSFNNNRKHNLSVAPSSSSFYSRSPNGQSPSHPNNKSKSKSKSESSRSHLDFLRLLSQAKPERPLLIAATIALFLSALLNLALPALVGTIIDAISETNTSSNPPPHTWLYEFISQLGFGDSPKAVLNVSAVLLVIIITFASIFSTLRGFWFSLAGERVVARLRKQLFSHLLQNEIAFFDATRTGELVNRLSTDTTVLKDAVTVNISMLLRWLATVVLGIAYLFVISWKLTLVMLTVVPIVAIGARFYGKKIKEISKKTQEALARATETADESISSIRTVRSFSQEPKQIQVYSDKIQTTYELGAKAALYYGIFVGLISFIASAAMILVLWFGSTLVLSGEITSGVLTSFVLYTLTVGVALAGLSGLFSSFMSALGACERVFQLIDRTPSIPTTGGRTLSPFKGHIQLCNVSFAYPARPDVKVLKGVNVELKPGTVTALVGESGGGKSTIVALIERWYDIGEKSNLRDIEEKENGKEKKKNDEEQEGNGVEEGELMEELGEILIDGHPLKELDLSWLHSHIALVSQDPVLFADTIRSNLIYGCNREVTEDELKSACRMANAIQFIEEFPDQFDTIVGERGVRLSGGQRQRISIARAVLMNPVCLLLDESTSSLDAESEFLVQQAIDRLMENRTVLVIAHRLSTVRNANKIYVIVGGRVVEEGHHQQLLDLKGVYAKLVARQLSDAPRLENGKKDQVEAKKHEERALALLSEERKQDERL